MKQPNIQIKFLAKLGLLVLALHVNAALADVAGHVQFISGDVQAVDSAGRVYPLKKGDAINEGDTLTSAKTATAQIKMEDGGFIAVRADTKMKFDSFKFGGKEDGKGDSSLFSLLRGGFRAVTGLIGRVHKESYRVNTPTATIGIRGTDYETVIIEMPKANLALADMPLVVADVSAPVIGNENPSFVAAIVNKGAIEMGTDKGKVLLRPGEGMVVSYGMNQRPVIKPVDATLFTPAAKGANKGGKQDGQNGESGGKKQEPRNGKSEKSDKTSSTSQDSQSNDTSSTSGIPAPTRETAVVDNFGQVITPGSKAVDTPAVSMLAPIVVTAPVVLSGCSGGTCLAFTTVASTDVSLLVLASLTSSGSGSGLLSNPIPNADNYGFEIVGAEHISPGVYGPVNPFGLDIPNTNIGLDSMNNLVGVKDLDPAINKGTHLLGGLAQDTYVSGDSSIRMGRWLGGSIATTDIANATTTSIAMGAGSAHWIVSANAPVGFVQGLTGTYNYILAAATSPTDALGHVGTLLNTSVLTVDFANQLVNMALDVQFTGAVTKLFNVTTPGGIFISSVPAEHNFIQGTGAVTCTGAGCANAYTALLSGTFAGATAQGIALAYQIDGSAADMVQGVAAFNYITGALAGAPSPYVQNGQAVNFAIPYRIATLSTVDTVPSGTNAGMTVPVMVGGYNNDTSVTSDAAGLLQFNGNTPFSNGMVTISRGTATATDLGTDPVSGISWGRWEGGTLGVTDRLGNTLPGKVNPGSSHWIASPTLVGPVDLPLSGTFNYVLAGGTAPTDSSRGVGTLNSATLTANFTAQTVNVGLNVTTPNAGNMVASGSNIPIEQKSFFNASTANFPNGGNPGKLAVTCTSCGAGTPMGQVSGVFSGSGAIGASMVYGLRTGSGVIVNGVTAFHR